MPDFSNPYAPPRADPAPYAFGSNAPYRTVDLSEALARLRAHVADPRNLEADRKAAGPRVRVFALVLVAIAAAIAVAGVVLGQALIGVLGGIFGFLGAVIVAVDLTLVSRASPAPPEKALKSFLKSIAMARFGYAWTCLSPTAREQTVASPDLAPVDTKPGTFPLRGQADMKEYTTSFARTSGSAIRTMGVKRLSAGPFEGDVVRVQAELLFQSWPRWVSIVSVVGFIVFRPLVIIGIVGYFATRKRRTVHVTKTMLRAPNGVFYVYDGDILEERRDG
jgi:hypothetical protein